jgi:hypothetical protein
VKLTKPKLKQLIKEELANVLRCNDAKPGLHEAIVDPDTIKVAEAFLQIIRETGFGFGMAMSALVMTYRKMKDSPEFQNKTKKS